MNVPRSTPTSAAGMGSFAVQEAAMYRRLSLLAVLGLLLTACAPYGGHGYYRTDVYSVDRYSYPGYSQPAYPYNRGYYVVPQRPRYYAPAPRYYQPAPPPAWHRPYPGPGGYDARYRHDGPRHDGPRRPDRDRDRDHGDWRGNRGGDRDGDRGRNH